MLNLKTLGGWQAVDEQGRTRPIPTQRVALLALLVVAGERGMSRDRIAGLLWPESTDEKARHSLGQSLYALRRDARAADIVLGTTTLTLNPTVASCDAWAFEAALGAGDVEPAVALYAGPFLSGIHLRGSADFQQAIDAERDRLARAYAGGLELLAREAAASDDQSGALGWWRRLATENPLSSRVVLELMRALVGTGDTVGALQAARVHEALVRQEFDAEPDAAVVDYARELRLRVSVTASPKPQARVDERQTTPPSPTDAVALPAGDMARDNATRDERSPHGVAERAASAARRRVAIRRAAWAAGGAAAAVALLVAAEHRRDARRLDPGRVYVAWLDNRTGSAALDPVGYMATDWVAEGLEQSGIVRVASSPRAQDLNAPPLPDAYRQPAMDESRHAVQVGAGSVVAGAYYLVGDSIKFQMRISDLTRGELLTSFTVAGAARDDPSILVEALRQRTVGALASAVDLRLPSRLPVKSKPPAYAAYREFLTGHYMWRTDSREALRHFERAAADDSTFYAARVTEATLHRLLGECDRTDSIATELLAIRSRLAPYEYHVLEAQVAQCHGDWQRAYRETRALAELRPGSALLDYGLALQARRLGRDREARRVLERHALEQAAAEVGPDYSGMYVTLLALSGETTRAVNVARWARDRFPTSADAWAAEAEARARAGESGLAERLLDSMAVSPVRPALTIPRAARRVASILMATGDTATGQRIASRALTWLAARGAGTGAPSAAFAFEEAQLLYTLGRLDAARARLGQLAAADTANVDYRGYLGLVAARGRDSTVASVTDAWLAGTRSPYRFDRTFYRARIAALLGQRDRALALLGTALNEMGRFTLPAVRDNADFATLREDERFTRLTATR